MGCLKQQTRDKTMNGGQPTFVVLTAHNLARLCQSDVTILVYWVIKRNVQNNLGCSLFMIITLIQSEIHTREKETGPNIYKLLSRNAIIDEIFD